MSNPLKHKLNHAAPKGGKSSVYQEHLNSPHPPSPGCVLLWLHLRWLWKYRLLSSSFTSALEDLTHTVELGNWMRFRVRNKWRWDQTPGFHLCFNWNHSNSLSCFSFFSQIFTRYGKCYTFNSGQDGRPLLVTMKGGMGNGLELMLDIQQDEYLPVWGETGKMMVRSTDYLTWNIPSVLETLNLSNGLLFRKLESCYQAKGSLIIS